MHLQNIFQQSALKPVNPVIPESKVSQEDLWIPYPGPDLDDDDDDDDDDDVMEDQPEAYTGHQIHYAQSPVYHHQEHPQYTPGHYHVPQHHQHSRGGDGRGGGVVRAPSFADRIKQANENPNVDM